MSRRNKLLVPEARDALERLKAEVIREQVALPPQSPSSAMTARPVAPTVADVASRLGIPYRPGANADLTTRQAGKIGGQIGGSMVKRLISLAEQNLQNSNLRP